MFTHRRRQAQRDCGEAEWRLHRAEGARQCSSLHLNRAEFDEGCLFNAFDKAEYDLLCITAALDRFRADIWDHIADFHECRARGVRPDPDAIDDLRFCRVQIAQLNSELPAALAASSAAAEVEKMRGSLDDVAEGASQAHASMSVRLTISYSPDHPGGARRQNSFVLAEAHGRS